ncbi:MULTISPECIES: RNA polymerase sigma factor [unclassified Breznakia]|uniref:RNA polymerase sigma factor n=1 Tax=unclassified Breznakia TaxID=2623764 RepID=UPI002404BD25|nr:MULTISPECIES: RNA polymerase sigma factor [unclassified Breznakia]MDF9837797.1 RNA polymerase sigma factor (sigma-70 family) [Breznakia sp. PFB2-8]MDF9859717.1 RNA polymerase sigma factor (sigma-70 family) [Breznakia sp. PH5-24]
MKSKKEYKKTGNRREIDVEYIERFRNGDIEAFNVIYDFYRDSIYYFGLKLMKNAADAEEIVQETFVNVFENIQVLKSNKAFHSWLFTIAFNRSQSLYRKRSKQVDLNEETNLEEIIRVDNDQVHEVESKEVYDAIKSELNQLSDKFFEVGMLKYYEGLSINEIAYILKIPEGTVKTRLRRIRKVIKPGLAERGYSPAKYFGFTFTPFAYRLFADIIQKNKMSTSGATEIYNKIIHSGSNAASVVVPAAAIGGNFISDIAKAALVGILGLGAAGSYVVYQNLNTETPQILDISYYQEPTNKKIEVKAKLNKNVEKSKVDVKQGKEAIAFDIQNDVLSFQVERNGDYTIKVAEDIQKISIDNIDKKAPEMVDIGYEDGTLSVKLKDEGLGLNYASSYILYKEEKIAIPANGEIKKEFEGEVYVTIYDKSGNMISYIVNIES